MDMDSPDKTMEGIKEVDETSLLEKPNLDFCKITNEQRGEILTHESDVPSEGMHTYMNQEYQGSPMQHAAVENEELQSPVTRSNSTDLSSPAKNYEDSDLNHNDEERRISDYSSERQEDVAAEEYYSHEGSEGADHVSLPGDGDKLYEAMDGQLSNQHTGRSPSIDETSNASPDNNYGNCHHESPEIDAKMDARNLNPCIETKGDDNPSAVASENGGTVWEISSQHSPQRNQNASPSPERQFSISAERSPRSEPSPEIHPSTTLKELSSPTNSDKKPASSPRISRRKHSPPPENHGVVRKRSPSPEKHGVVRKRASSRDRSSPGRLKSPSGRTMQRDSHHRDNSPKRRVSPSPRRRDSPRRRGRSASRSPVRRRESPGNRRDQHHKSRLRSPVERDRYRRSPRRRNSPRRRSPPPSHYRPRSPRRPRSPPPTRCNGLGMPGNNLFVAGFSYVTTERDLEKKFSRFGRVTDVRMVRDRRSGESRGFGFLSLEKDEDADEAIRSLDQTEWNGRIILVEKTKTSSR